MWNSITSTTGLGGLTALLDSLGAVLVVVGIVAYVLERRRNKDANHHKLLMTILLGSILSGPGLVLPLILGLLDLAVNAAAAHL